LNRTQPATSLGGAPRRGGPAPAAADLADFVLDYCRALGAVVEPPAFGVYDVLLPDAVAAQLGVDAFQRWTFDAPADGETDGHAATRLGYGHPLVEGLVALARAAPACAHFYLNAGRLDKTGLLDLARAELAFANAILTAAPQASEARAQFHVVRFNFKAALVSDEKRERLVSVLLDAHTGAVRPELSADEALRLEAAPAFPVLPNAPAAWRAAPDPLAPAELGALLERATQAAAAALADPLAALRQRTARLLELDRARLEAYYAELENDLTRRLKRADDQARQATLADKLAATRADHAAKLVDAEAKYRLRLELELVNLAIVTQPKVMLPVRIENRQAAVTRHVVWDPLRHRLELLTCDVCRQPSGRLFLCANQHLACERCLAPQCVDCRRVYCRQCAEAVTTCAVCGRAVCQKSLVRCPTCGQGTCREHAGQCHAPPAGAAPSPQPTPAAPAKAPRPKQPVPVKAPRSKPPAPAGPTPPVSAYRLQVEVYTDKALVVGFVLTSSGAEVAQRSWELTADGLQVACRCEKGRSCPVGARRLAPEPAARIEAQVEAELDRLRAEYRIPPYRATVLAEGPDGFTRQPRLHLRGPWKNPELLNAARAAQSDEATAEASPPPPPPLVVPPWVLALTPAEAARVMPEIDRFVRLSYGWLVLEGALAADELAALAAGLAQPGDWYSMAHARDLYKADPQFRVLRGKVIAIALVEHPLKVLQAKAARALSPRTVSAAELLVVAADESPLTAREVEIEQALNQRITRRVYLRSIQRLMRNAENPEPLLTTLVDLREPRAEAKAFRDLLTELWNATTRYELRGRTPNEAGDGL